LQQRHWTATAAEEHATMVLASASSKLRATFMTLASALARTAREDTSDARDVYWQLWQGDRSIAAAGGGGGITDTMIVLRRKGQGDNCTGPA
jgi:hypothetical protein